MSLIKIINRRGPRIEPWGTPDLIMAFSDRLDQIAVFLVSVCEVGVKPANCNFIESIEF